MKSHPMLTAAVVLTLLAWISVGTTRAHDGSLEAASLLDDLSRQACVAGEASISPLAAIPGARLPWDTVPSLRSCSGAQGAFCSPPGSYVLCSWVPGETDVCICQSNYRYRCG